jgi:FkbM family methyltransferase
MIARVKRKGPWPTASALLRRIMRDLAPVEVVDVGANPIEGDAPYRRLLDQGLCHVTGFEPQLGPLAELNARKSDHETYHPHALGAGGAADLHLFRHSGFTSLFAVDPAMAALLGFGRATREAGTVPVDTLRLDDVPGLLRIDFLKIDVQGAETMIVAGGQVRLAETMLIQTEVRFVPLYAGEPCFAGLDTELRRQGFLFHDFAFLKRVHLQSPSASGLRPSTKRQVVDGDAFYLRDLSDLTRITDNQLRRLAMLADQVMEDAGVVLFCLDALEARRAIGRGMAARYRDALPAAVRIEA